MRDFLRAFLAGAATAVVLFAVLFAVALWAAQRQEIARRHLADALAAGMLHQRAAVGPLDNHPAPNLIYDCIIFNMIGTTADHLVVSAMSNRWVGSDSPVNDPRAPADPFCQSLLRAFPELRADGWDRIQVLQYDNYILGMRVLGRLLLSFMPANAIGRLLLGTGYGLLAMIGLLALYRLARSPPGSAARPRAAGYLVIAGCFAAFYGFSYFGPTLNFGLLDSTHFAFILISLFVPLGAMRPVGLAVFAAAYGSLVAMFEFLTGGIPIALALLPLLLGLGFAANRRAYFTKLTVLWGSFCLAVVLSFALKKQLAVLLLGDTTSFLGPLATRMQGTLESLPGSIGAGASQLDIFMSQVALYRTTVRNIGGGSARLGAALVIAALSTMLIVAWRNRRSLWSFDRPIRPASLLSLGALLAWIAVFFQHTVMHPFAQARLLIIPILAAGTLAVSEILVRGARDRQTKMPEVPSRPKFRRQG
jgi:hypothetical protein